MNFTIQNVGKIKNAEITLKPLTIFIGKNNSGKTYATTALWSLIDYVKKFRKINSIFKNTELHHKYKDIISSFITEKQINLETIIDHNDISNARKTFNDHLDKESDRIMNESFKFSGFQNSNIKINTANQNSKLVLNVAGPIIEDNDGFVCFKLKLFNDEENPITHTELFFSEHNDDSNDYIVNEILEVILKTIINFALFGQDANIFMRNIYIPAARTGIMLNLNNIISRPFESKIEYLGEYLSKKNSNTDDFTKPISDFALKIFRHPLTNIRKDSLLDSILDGKIIKETHSDRYKYLSANMNRSIPLSATSSLITELTPIAILNDKRNYQFILFEEPEAHLHLEAQREIAKVIARMINSGIKMVITTHSDTFLQQLNNLILLNRLKEKNKDISDFNIKDDELLQEKDIAAYDFKCENNETDIIAIKCGKYGFVADSLNEVLQSLAKQSLDIIDALDEEV